MFHRFQLLFATGLIWVSVAPAATGGISLSNRWLNSGDRLLHETRSIVNTLELKLNSTIEQPVATPVGWIVASSDSPILSPTVSATDSPTDIAPAASRVWIGWVAMGLLPIGAVVAILYALRFKEQQKSAYRINGNLLQAGNQSLLTHEKNDCANTDAAADRSADSLTDPDASTTVSSQADADENGLSDTANDDQSIDSNPSLLPISTTTRLTKIDIVEVLVRDLRSSDPSQRRKAIWELGQRGDSRAIQPLVDLLIDSDSTQRGLILAATTEISIRTLKPMNRAMMLSLQDSSPEVRKNALRDVTRVFELVTQTTQLLHYSASDPDTEVRNTAEWALGQLYRVYPSTETAATPTCSTLHHLQNSSTAHLSSLAEETDSAKNKSSS